MYQGTAEVSGFSIILCLFNLWFFANVECQLLMMMMFCAVDACPMKPSVRSHIGYQMVTILAITHLVALSQ